MSAFEPTVRRIRAVIGGYTFVSALHGIYLSTINLSSTIVANSTLSFILFAASMICYYRLQVQSVAAFRVATFRDVDVGWQKNLIYADVVALLFIGIVSFLIPDQIMAVLSTIVKVNQYELVALYMNA
jgi:hypothetical protein